MQIIFDKKNELILSNWQTKYSEFGYLLDILYLVLFINRYNDVLHHCTCDFAYFYDQNIKCRF